MLKRCFRKFTQSDALLYTVVSIGILFWSAVALAILKFIKFAFTGEWSWDGNI